MEALLARGTFEQRKQGHKLNPIELTINRPALPPRPKTFYRPDIPVDFDDLIEDHYKLDVVDAVGKITRDLSKKEAKRWAWDESDELAIHNGCRFDLKRAMHFAYTLRNEMSLWEGRWSGEPLILRTWQPECLLRIYGWVRPHEELGWLRRYSKSAIWVPKKSGKSPTGASSAIYAWRFDGHWKHKDDNEPTVGGGQHVFCIAKNGKQAGIVWGHAKNMVHNSPRTKTEVDKGEIRTNEHRSLLRYMPKMSQLTTITGDTAGSLAAAEGINAACIICDEAHVVDERTVEVTRDAGASQEQFLWFQISTYGNTEGYGKKDLELGRDVAAGKVKDDAFFFRTYEAPQDATDSDCGREEIWKQANPNLGYTVSARQFQQSYERAKDDPSQFSGWKQRRLNIWQRAANPMFNMGQWDKAATDLPYEKLKGVGGGAGLDLAASEDWAALAIAWDVEKHLHIWVKLWLTEDWVHENNHRAPFSRWLNDGWITVHDGGAVDFEAIENDVLDILRHTRTRCLGYDKMFGMQMSQNLRRRQPRVGIYKFSQSVESYAVGTAELKVALKNGTLVHPGNPALDWQAGHCRSKILGNYEKPVKDDEQLWQKIDGIQATCMAIDCKRYAQSPAQPWVAVV